MKIAIPVVGQNLDSEINEHFGRAEQFLLVDMPGRSFELWSNSFKDGQGGVGSKVTSALVKEGVEAVFVDSLGGNAQEVLERAKVSVFRDCKGRVVELLDRFEGGQLEAGN